MCISQSWNFGSMFMKNPESFSDIEKYIFKNPEIAVFKIMSRMYFYR